MQIAHFKLSNSRAFFVRAYLLQTHEMLFDAHFHAFQIFGGVPERGIYDNMMTAVDKVRKSKQWDVNKRFTAMVSHYLFEADFCNAAAGWEKGRIEKNVLDTRRRIWSSWTNWVICRSVKQAGHCCSTSSASSMKKPASS